MTTIVDVAADYRKATGRNPFGSPRWEATYRAFYGLELRDEDVANLLASTQRTEASIRALSGTGRACRELWARVGRRGLKSSEAAFVASYEACFGGHEGYLLPGERGLIAVVSKDIAGSTAVARFCEIHAQALGIGCHWTSMGSVKILELEGFPFGVACFPCSATAPRGYAVPVVIADEIAHWATDAEEYVNADSAVLAAIKPAMAQFRDSKLIAISSPLGEDGIFHETVEQNLGDKSDHGVLAVEGPSWEWNPEITEARTHELERDPDTHAREYGAQPSRNEGTAFRSDDVAACYEEQHGQYRVGERFMVWDPGESLDTFAWCCAAWLEPDPTPAPVILYAPASSGFGPGIQIGQARDEMGAFMWHPIPDRPLLRVFDVGGITGEELRQTTMDRVVDSLAQTARNYGVKVALTDQRGAPYLAAMASKHQLSVRSFTWTQERKHEAVILIRSLMRDRQLSLVQHDEMKRQLLRYKRRIVGGGFKYGTPRQHDDYAALLLTLGMALGEEQQGTPTNATHFTIQGSPTQKQFGGRRTMSGR